MTLSAADWQAWGRLVPGVHMRQIYGQTESVTAVLGGAPWEADDHLTIGRPLLGVDQVKLAGPDGREVPDGEPGELWVKGEPGRTLMLGYHHAPEATADVLVDGRWLRTGDQMIRRPSGRFEFRRRAMHIIRRGGENLSTYVLEADLRSCPLINDVAIAARKEDTLDAVDRGPRPPPARIHRAGVPALVSGQHRQAWDPPTSCASAPNSRAPAAAGSSCATWTEHMRGGPIHDRTAPRAGTAI
jgi:acyl-CoA synthetase (AMP-forming)/AMP-acid ligase II